MSAFSNFAEDRLLIRRTSPVIHNITNYVAMNFCANSLLALGASPIMSSEPAEVEELVSSSQALVINIGCIESLQLDAMLCAARQAAALGRPWVLDPVGAGLSRFRTRAALALAELGPAVIRGNASEILSLWREAGLDSAKSAARSAQPGEKAPVFTPETAFCGLPGEKAPVFTPETVFCGLTEEKSPAFTPTGPSCEPEGNSAPHGLDSRIPSTEATSAAAALARRFACTVVVSGAVDVVTDGVRGVQLRGGSPLMACVTATGCCASAFIAAFLAVEDDRFCAALNAMALMSLCGEKAAALCQGPGSFVPAFIDSVYSFDDYASAESLVL